MHARPAAALALTRAISALLIASIALAIAEFTQRPVVPRKPQVTGLYETGRYYWDMRSREGVRRSLDYFTKAIDANPSDARAYAGLADANVSMGDYCYGTHLPAVYIARAEQYAQQALLMDPRSAEAHASAGFIALHQDRTRDAFAHLRRALSLSPSLAAAREWYAIALLQSGQRQQGAREMRTALRLDQLSVASVAWLSSIAYAEHRYNDAIRYARMALELSPKRMDALAIMGQAYAARGDLNDAHRTFARYASVDPYYRAQAQALVARVDAAAHRMQQARSAFAYALAHANAVEDNDLAAAALAVGDVRVARGVQLGKAGHASWLAIEDAARFAAFYSVLRIRIVSQTSPVWRVTSFS